MAEDEFGLKEKVSKLPTTPGVYQFFDANGVIIYIGKAKNLKNRVSSYFVKTNQTSKTMVLVRKIRDLKYIVVNTEEDALLLENNLIKKYKPRYNILLKDHNVPRERMTPRNVYNTDSRYAVSSDNVCIPPYLFLPVLPPVPWTVRAFHPALFSAPPQVPWEALACYLSPGEHPHSSEARVVPGEQEEPPRSIS